MLKKPQTSRSQKLELRNHQFEPEIITNVYPGRFGTEENHSTVAGGLALNRTPLSPSVLTPHCCWEKGAC